MVVSADTEVFRDNFRFACFPETKYFPAERFTKFDITAALIAEENFVVHAIAGEINADAVRFSEAKAAVIRKFDEPVGSDCLAEQRTRGILRFISDKQRCKAYHILIIINRKPRR